MALTVAEFATFETLVRDNIKHELGCRQYLEHAEHLLIRETLRSTVQFHEVRSYVGDADLILAADIVTDTGEIERVAFLWELKAPQCYLFEYDNNNNRCRPTRDFVKAENQLLHYTDEAAGTENTRARLGILKSSNIRPGGIIIGRKDRMLRAPRTPSDIEKASTALQLRRERLYRSQGVQILLWDLVLDAVRPTSLL